MIDREAPPTTKLQSLLQLFSVYTVKKSSFKLNSDTHSINNATTIIIVFVTLFYIARLCGESNAHTELPYDSNLPPERKHRQNLTNSL